MKAIRLYKMNIYGFRDAVINFNDSHRGNSIMLVLPLLFLTWFLLSLNQAKAQQIESATGAPTQDFEVANGTRTFTVTVLGGPVSSGSLMITLPAGYQYVGNSATPSGGLGISQTSVSGNTATLALTGIPNTGTNTTFTFKARASCAAIGVEGNQATYVLSLAGGAAQPEKLSNAFNLKNAKINITNLANSPATPGVVGDNYTRTYRINNNGFGSIDTIYVADVSGNGVAHISHSVSTTNLGEAVTVSLLSTTTSGSNTTYLYRFIVSSTAQDNHLGQNEYLTFTQNLKIASCSDLNTGLNAYYGIGPDNVQFCPGQNDTQTTALAIDNSKTPNLSVEYVSTDLLACAPSSSWVTVKVTNSGNAPATVPSLRFGLQAYAQTLAVGSTEYNNAFAPIWIDESAGIEFSTDGGSSWGAATHTSSTFIANTATNVDARGKPLDVIIAPPTIAAGQTILVRFKRHIECREVCQNDSYFFRGISLLSGSYKKDCGDASYSLPYTTLRGEASIRGEHQPEMPVDAMAGQPYWVQYHIGEWLAGGAGPQNLLGTGAYTELVIKLPDCLVPDMSTLAVVDGNTGTIPVTPDQVYTDADGIHIRFNMNTTDWTAFNLSNKMIKLKTTVNCAIACPSKEITSKIMFKQSASCACSQVLNCTSWTPVFHCPDDCSLSLGINNNESSATRVNIGAPDNNNDGIADAPGANFPSKVKTQYFTIGDEIQVTATGEVFGTGSFVNAYLSTTAPSNVNLSVIPNSGKVDIVDASSSTTYTLSNLPVTGTYPSIGVDLSVSALTAAGLPAGFAYANGDKITVSVNYSYPFAGNFTVDGNGNGYTNQQKNVPVNFSNVLYGSLSPNPAQADRLICDGPFVATMYHQSMQWGYHNQSRDFKYNGCTPDDLDGSTNGMFFVTQFNSIPATRNRNNIFPFEINTKINPKEFVFTLPPGFTSVNTKVWINDFSPTVSFSLRTLNSPDQIVGQDYHYNLENIINSVKGVPYSEEGWQFVLLPVLRATCQSAPSGVISHKVTYTIGTDPTLRTASKQWAYTVNGQNNITAVPSQPIQTVNGNTVSWEIQVTNTSNDSEMLNVWLGKKAAGGGTVTITSVQKLPNGGAASGTAVAVTGDIYQLGSIPASTSQYYKVTGTFSNCTQDNLQLAFGSNCAGYPASVATAPCSGQVDLTVIPTPANLQVSLIGQPVPTYPDGTVDLCQELEYTAEVKNPAQGTTYDLKFVVNKRAGVAYIANSFQLSPSILPTAASLTAVNNDATYVTETSTTITFTIPASVAANLPFNQGYTIRYKVKTVACDFVSGTKMNLQALGNNGCGSAINGSRQQTQAVRIKGENLNPNGYVITSSVSEPINGCSPNGATYTFSAKNDGTVPTYTNESIRITIPKPFTLGSVTGISNFTSGSTPTVTSDATSTTYVWTMPTGVAVNQSISFSAPLSAPAADIEVLSCSELPIYEMIAYSFDARCEPSGPVCTGTLQAEAENESTHIIIAKPGLNITNFTAGTPTAGNKVEGTVTVSNLNGVTSGLPQAASITIYHDSNNNGVVDAGDITIGTQSVTISTSSPQTFGFSHTSTYTGNLCPALVVLDPTCACSDPVVFKFACDVALPVNLANFEAKQAETGVILTWATASESNSDRFEIERSLDGKTWQNVGTRIAGGDTKSNRSYEFTDYSPATGLNYYRLKMVDRDETFAHSRIRTVRVSTSGASLVYPNPVSESLQLRAIDDVVQIEIFDVKGVQVFHSGKPVSGEINVEKLVPGIYVIKLTKTSGISESQKIVKK